MKNLLVALLAITPFALKAQGNYDKDALRKLAELSVNMDEMEMEKLALASYSVVPDKKEDFKKEYDAATTALLEDMETFYKTHYTPEEVKQLAAFYDTPAGRKLAKDNMGLLSNDFPEGKEWSMQLYDLEKKEKEEKKP